MTKAQFLTTLRMKLSVLPPEECNELMEDYESHFAFGLQNGKSEEEIVAELGDPEELAKEALGSRYVPERPVYWFDPERPDDEQIESAPPIPPVQPERQSKLNNNFPTGPVTSKKGRKPSYFFALTLILVGIIGIAYFGLGFVNNKDTSESLTNYSQRWNYDITKQELQSVSIETDFDIDIEYMNTDAAEGYVEITGNMPQPLIDNLKATKITGTLLHLKLNNSDSLQWLSMDFSDKEHKLRVIIASNQDQPLNEFIVSSNSSEIELQTMFSRKVFITVSSGDIQAHNITADQLFLTSASGSLSANHLLAKNIMITTASGDVSLQNTTGNLTSQSTSGELKVEKINGNINVKSSSGDILIDQLKGDGKIQTSSGEVMLNRQRSDRLSISTSSGDVILSKDSEFQGKYNLSTSSGDVIRPDSPAITADTITITTSSGDIMFN
jgi:hypothetical protein